MYVNVLAYAYSLVSECVCEVCVCEVCVCVCEV